MSDKSPTYYYNGPRNAAGRATEALAGIPARDLTERDVARLSDAQVKTLSTRGSTGRQLYTKTPPSGTDTPKPAKDSGDATA